MNKDDVKFVTNDDVELCPTCFAILPKKKEFSNRHLEWHSRLRLEVRLASSVLPNMFGEESQI